MRNTSGYIINLLIVAFLATSVVAQKKPAIKNDSVPLLNGLRIEADISPVVTWLSGNSSIYNYEGAVQFYIQNRYFPVFEAGFSGADKQTVSDIRYKGNGMFYRIGFDFNMLKPKEGSKPTNNMLLLGTRLGFTSFQYNLSKIDLSDDYWKDSYISNLDKIANTKLWFEITGGLRVELTKNIFAGWTFRYKNLITKDQDGAYKPWYIPGYGLNTEGVWGFNYLVGYKF